MKSNKQFFSLLLLLLVAVGLAVFNFFKIKEMNLALKTQQEQIDTTPSVVNSIIKQRELQKALDSIKPDEGSKAPFFSLEDAYGNTVSLNDLKKPKALLVFSSAQCHTCKDFYPHLQQFVNSQKKVDVVVIQIDADKTSNLAFLKKNGYNFTLLEGSRKLFSEYKVISTPTSILIDTATKTIIKSGDLFVLKEIQDFVGV